MERVMVFDDVGFGVSVGLFGKELYSSILAYIYERYLGFKVYKVSPCIAGATGDVLCVGSRAIPVIRGFYDAQLARRLESLIRELGVDAVHVNIVNPRYASPLIASTKHVGVMLITTLHNWYVVCPTGWKVRVSGIEPCDTVSPSFKCLGCIMKLGKTGGRVRSFAKMLMCYYGIRRLARCATNAELGN